MDDLLKLTTFDGAHKHRPYVNSAVRLHHQFTARERFEAAQKAGFNVFEFPSEMVIGDLLSDSGTTTPFLRQIAMSLLGDEAYGTNWGYPQLVEMFEETFGISGICGSSSLNEWEYYFFHQCRAAEHALFTQIGKGKQGLIIPNNGHFDTTRANIEASGIEARDLPIASTQDEDDHFQGNMDVVALDMLLTKRGNNVPVVYMTITNNTIAGQPVSMENLIDVYRICQRHGTPLFFDAARFALNAWFIKKYEPGYANWTIREITHRMFDLCDGFTISLKKDGLTNMGGALVMKKASPLIEAYPNLLENVRDYQILTEGHPTYGGMSGRDIMVLVEGLKESQNQAFLDHYIGLTGRFGAHLDSLGIPIVKPVGGHAVYIDMDRFFEGTRMKRENFGGISFTSGLLLNGPRLCELGAFAFGTYDPETGAETPPPFNYVRAAIPRNKYEQEDLLFIADCIKNLHDRRDSIPRAVPVYGRDKSLRHFKARFELAR